MNFRDLILNRDRSGDPCEKGALCGDTLNPISRVGDLENKISVATTGAYFVKDSFKEWGPFYRQTVKGVESLYPTYHFLVEARRQLSGDATTSYFSPEEEEFYKEYEAWCDGKEQYGWMKEAVETFDKWLIDELMDEKHPELMRDYGPDHPWMKV